jgi:hypothetical protein
MKNKGKFQKSGSNLFSPEEITKDLSGAWETFQKLTDEEKAKNPQWYSKHITVDWDADPFLGGNSTRYWNVSATFAGRRGFPAMRFIGEKVGNTIMPKNEKDAVEMRKKNPNSKVKIEARGNNKAYIQVKKYNDKVQSDEKDKYEYKKGPDGKPILPNESNKSKMYEALWWYFKAVTDEIKYQKSKKRIANDDSKDGAPKKYIHSDNLSVASPIKEEVKKGDFRGKRRLNPYVQIGLKFGQDDPMKNTQWLDKRKKFIKDGRTDFEAATTESGEKINDDNVHQWVAFGQTMDGSINIGSICISTMGISCQGKAKMIITQPREKRAGGASDIYDGEGDQDIDDEEGEGDEESQPKDDNKLNDSGKPDSAKVDLEKAKSNKYQEAMNLMKGSGN